jgi:hypothetical protein
MSSLYYSLIHLNKKTFIDPSMSERFIQVSQKRRLLEDGGVSPNITFPDKEEEEEEPPFSSDDADEDQEDTEDDNVVYLDKNEMRHEFGLCQETRDITKKFTVRICAFEIRNDDTKPFLLHAMQFDGVVFDFPQFTFQCASNVDDDAAVYFQNECLQHLSDFVEDIDDVVYRGFVLDTSSSSSSSTTDDVYVFYDIVGKKLTTTTTTPRVWVTVDEFFNVGFVLGHPVQASLPTFFLKHPHLIFLYQHGKRVYVPEVMFICDDDGSGGYVNLSSSTDNQEEVAFLDNRISHDILGNFYIFSKFPLIADKFTWRRFVGFCQDNIYLTKPLPQPRNLSMNMTLGQVIPSMVNYVYDKQKAGPETGATGSETGATSSETGATGSETGLFSSMFSNTSSDTGATGSDTGATGSETGSTGGFFSNMFSNTVSETGATGPDMGPTGSETGLFSSMFSNTVSETGPTGSDTGSTGSETGLFSSMFSNTNSESGPTGSYTGATGPDTGATGSETGPSTGNNSLFKIFGGGSTETEPADPAIEDDTNRLMSFLSDQTVSCIYFQEISSADEIIPFWCIKTDEYYVEV